MLTPRRLPDNKMDVVYQFGAGSKPAAPSKGCSPLLGAMRLALPGKLRHYQNGLNSSFRSCSSAAGGRGSFGSSRRAFSKYGLRLAVLPQRE